MFYHFKKLDWVLITSAFILTIIGLVSIYSSSIERGSFLNFKKQIIFFLIGIFLMFLLSFFDWRAFCQNPYFILILYFACIAMLAGLLLFAPATRGVKGWYKIGPVSVDPIELTKIVLIILLAKYFSMRHIEMYKITHIILSAVYIFIPAFLIFLQPDFGSALILVVLWIGILLVSGIRLGHFLVLVFCGILLLSLSWSFFLKDYQRARVMSFLAPQVEPLGASWSQNQSKIAIGSGGLLGQGFGNGSQTQYRFLSEPQTDFIFAAIAEEFGLLGIAIIFSLLLIFIWRIMKTALLSHSNFPRLFAFGFIIILVFQIFIHIGMNLGVLPVIGLALPLVSYGGSGLITSYITLGILLNIKKES